MILVEIKNTKVVILVMQVMSADKHTDTNLRKSWVQDKVTINNTKKSSTILFQSLHRGFTLPLTLWNKIH